MRTALPLAGGTGAGSSTAAAAAMRMRTHVGAGLERRLNDADPVDTPPWGVWNRGESDATPRVHLDPALARYAEMLRRRRRTEQSEAPRGLPLASRRRSGTAVGPRTGPGGLARRTVPVDRPERPEITAIVSRGAASTAPVSLRPQPSPLRGGA